jgi:DinB superfamily
MKKLSVLLLLILPFSGAAQDKKAPTDLRGVLMEQLRTTHNAEDWFVPVSIAVDGMTAEQAQWKPAGKDAHSVGQLAYHIWYWDSRSLQHFKGEKPAPFDGNNNETFDKFSAAQWDDLVKKLNQEMADWEAAVQSADEAKLAANASLIAHIGAHRAYHVGQILYVRKLQGSWNPDKGVK